MSLALDESFERLDAALNFLEVSVSRRLEIEKRRGDLATELQLMQDDRAQLAVELDSTTSRLQRVENAARDADTRIERAVEAIRSVLVKADSAA